MELDNGLYRKKLPAENIIAISYVKLSGDFVCFFLHCQYNKLKITF